MKLIQINTVCNESTGRIMLSIQRAADAAGYETLSIYGRRTAPGDVNTRKTGDFFSFWSHVCLTTVFDLHGMGSSFETRRMIRVLREEKPDIIHLHNLHGYYLNYPILFDYLKNEFSGRVFWTLHDCWAFTGHCAHYVIAGCSRWKDRCYSCPNQRQYPVSLFLDQSAQNYKRKKETFCGLPDMTIIVPSQWLREQVSASFLSSYRTVVIPNGIDLERFRKKDELIREEILARYGIDASHKIILSVASHWDKGKGIDTFGKIAELMPDSYRIVLVGAGIRSSQFRSNKITVIGRTENQEELVDLYNCASVYINTSVQETFSLVTLEAMACGLPVIALDTSAVKELVPASCGIVLHKPAAKDYLDAIQLIGTKVSQGIISRDLLRAKAMEYPAGRQVQQYLELYGETQT